MGCAPRPVPARLVHGRGDELSGVARSTAGVLLTVRAAAPARPAGHRTGPVPPPAPGRRRRHRRCGRSEGRRRSPAPRTATRTSTSTRSAGAVTSPVLVLLDVSGSAGEPGTGGRPVHEHQTGRRDLARHRPSRPRRPGRGVRLQLEGTPGGAAPPGQDLRRPPRRSRSGDASPASLPRPTRGSVQPSATARRSSRTGPGRRGACSSCSRTGSPTTTATRADTARPMPGGRCSRPGAGVSVASA